jgi:ketosteroid isomerase-like protein
MLVYARAFDFRRICCLIVLPMMLLTMSLNPACAQTADEEALHNELRALKDRLTTALNNNDIEAALQETSPNVVFTAMNNDVAHGHDELRGYFERMMKGDSRIVDELKVSFEPDQLSTIYGGTNAIAVGSSKAHFKLAQGLEFDVDGRWTADLVKEGGKWQLSAIHYSVNMFDNPLLNNAKNLAWMVGAGAAVIGLLVGYFAGRMRRRAPAAA